MFDNNNQTPDTDNYQAACPCGHCTCGVHDE